MCATSVEQLQLLIASLDFCFKTCVLISTEQTLREVIGAGASCCKKLIGNTIQTSVS